MGQGPQSSQRFASGLSPLYRSGATAGDLQYCMGFRQDGHPQHGANGRDGTPNPDARSAEHLHPTGGREHHLGMFAPYMQGTEPLLIELCN